MRATLSRPSALPSRRVPLRGLAQKASGTIEHLSLISTRQLGRRAMVVFVNLLVAAVVMSLPFLASAAAHPTEQASAFSNAMGSTSLAPADGEPLVSRAITEARGGTITAGRSPVTIRTEGAAPLQEYTLSADDTLWTIANFYGLTAEAVAFANGITDPYHLQLGRHIVIPPHEGALYTVADGDTVEALAARFNVEPAAIKTYDRTSFDSQSFATGEMVFIAGATLPTLPAPPQANASVIARPAVSLPAARSGGYLAWPVAGVITQYMWAGHTGVDIAAPYGSGLAASVNGVISENGWVAVGGLHICVKSGNLEECYYHMSAAYLSVGTPVSAGQIVGAIGLTGVTTGPHVHWETKINGSLVNPLAVQP